MAAGLVAGLVGQESRPGLEAEGLEHRGVLVTVVVGGGEELVTVKYRVGAGEEAQSLVKQHKIR